MAVYFEGNGGGFLGAQSFGAVVVLGLGVFETCTLGFLLVRGCLPWHARYELLDEHEQGSSGGKGEERSQDAAEDTASEQGDEHRPRGEP